MLTIDKDVIVIGLGAWGSAALWRLAERGIDVAGIERYGIGHHMGSTHGQTRLFRIACQEHPGLPPIALKSLELWTQLGQQDGNTYVRQTGCLGSGTPGSLPVAGAIAAAESAGQPITKLSHAEFVAEYPNYAYTNDDDVAVWDAAAGICYPEKFVRGQVAAAQRAGAEVYPHTMVTSIDYGDDKITIHTPTVDFTANKIVLALGAWLGKYVPELPLRPRRTPLYWFKAKPGHERDYRLENFPGFIRELPDGMVMWGHGSAEDYDIKIGLDDDASTFTDCDADTVDRYIHQQQDIDLLKSYVAKAFPGVEPQPAKAIPCMITRSPDEQFIVGPLATDPRVVVAGGDSGHGAKHAAGLGEIIAQQVVGEQPYCDVSFIDPARF